MNPALVYMLGYPDKETPLAEAARSVYAKPSSRRRWTEQVEAEGSVSLVQARWRRRAGSTIWVKENSHAVRDASGEILYYEGSAKDITTRRTIEAKLVEEKTRFEQLFAASPEAVVLCANDATVPRVNAEFTRLFGCSEEGRGSKHRQARLRGPERAPRTRL